MSNKLTPNDPKVPPQKPNDPKAPPQAPNGDDENNGWSTWPTLAKIAAVCFVGLWLIGGILVLTEVFAK